MSISKEIITVLDEFCRRFGIVVDWTSENILPYVKDLATRFIAYIIYTSAAWIGIMCGVTLICWLVTIPLVKKVKKAEWDEYEEASWAGGIALVVSGIVSLVTIIVAGFQIMDILTAITLPEVSIINYLQTLAN